MQDDWRWEENSALSDRTDRMTCFTFLWTYWYTTKVFTNNSGPLMHSNHQVVQQELGLVCIAGLKSVARYIVPFLNRLKLNILQTPVCAFSMVQVLKSRWPI